MADRPASPPPQQRDLVYCHQCENEWYRDEHGLICPECQSDFTEIIEPNHDPRDDQVHVLPNEAAPERGFREFYDTPDPDEEDIDRIQWRQTGPGRMTGTIRRTINIQPGQQPQQQDGQQGQGGGIGGMVLGAIGSFLSGALGGIQQQHQQQQHQQHEPSQTSDRPQSATSSSTPASGGSGNGGSSGNVRHYQFPGGSMTISNMTFNNGAGANFPNPRNANGPQPYNPQPELIDHMMAQMFANIGVFPLGQRAPIFGPAGVHPSPPFFIAGGGGQGMPINFFELLLSGGAGGPRLGDAVFSQEDLDRVITHLMEQHQSGNAPGPATDAAIKSLPSRPLATTDLDETTGKADCSICMDEVPLGDPVTVLPCAHWFHRECVTAWLREHDTCPHCRRGIMPQGEGGEQRAREASEAPLNDMHRPEFQGPVESGFAFREDEGQDRRASNADQSSGGSRRESEGGGLLGRMRDAFGGGGGGSSSAGERPPFSPPPPPPPPPPSTVACRVRRRDLLRERAARANQHLHHRHYRHQPHPSRGDGTEVKDRSRREKFVVLRRRMSEHLLQHRHLHRRPSSGLLPSSSFRRRFARHVHRDSVASKREEDYPQHVMMDDDNEEEDEHEHEQENEEDVDMEAEVEVMVMMVNGFVGVERV